jgi:hypothetical protein
VLRLFESNEVAAAPQILSGSPGIPQALPQQSGHWDQDIVGMGDPVSFLRLKRILIKIEGGENSLSRFK